MKVNFSHKTEESEDIKTFYFEKPEDFKYTAGQFIELTIDHPLPDDRGKNRWFTISSSPSDDFLSITTRLYAASSTFKQALDKLQKGTQVNISEPMGDFVLPKLIQTPLVFVAGGIGITPYHSIIKYLIDAGEQRNIKMLYSVAKEDDIIFFEQIKKYLEPTIVVGEASPSWGGERGRLSGEMIVKLSEITPETLIFVSGPESMTESLSAQLKKAGIKENQLVLDFFPNYSSI